MFLLQRVWGEIAAAALLGRKMAPETGLIMYRQRINLVTDSNSAR